VAEETSADKERRGDTARERAEAAEEASRSQGSHYHSRMEAEQDAPLREAARNGSENDNSENVNSESAGAFDEGKPSSNVRAQPPEEFTGGHIDKPKEVAGGIPAVWVATKHIAREMGLSTRRTASTARAAPGPTPTASARTPSSARTARRPSPRRRPTQARHAGVLPRVERRRPLAQVRLLARQAGPHHAPRWSCATRATTTSRLIGTRLFG
jgi:hypothetical protein